MLLQDTEYNDNLTKDASKSSNDVSLLAISVDFDEFLASDTFEVDSLLDEVSLDLGAEGSSLFCSLLCELSSLSLSLLFQLLGELPLFLLLDFLLPLSLGLDGVQVLLLLRD